MNLTKVLVLIFILVNGLLFAQKEKEVKVKTPKGNLYGTLLLPEQKKNIPVALIIPGSGPTDRDGNSMMVQANSYKYLAEALQEKGIASLRYDKRGIGKSEALSESEASLRFDDAVDDAVAWIQQLRENKKFDSIIIIGHSQGSLIGMLAAQKTDVDAYISIAGAGRSIDEILKKQLNTGVPEMSEETEHILQKLKQGDTIDDIPTQLMSIFRPSVQPFLISWIKYDPVQEIEKLQLPVMIIQGTTDIQVSTEEAKLLADAANVEVTLIEGMNHVLKDAPLERVENLKTYYDPAIPLSDSLAELIISFIIQS